MRQSMDLRAVGRDLDFLLPALVLGAIGRAVTWYRRSLASRLSKALAGRWRPLALAGALLVDVLLVVAHLAAPTVERTLGPADVIDKEGHAYLFPPKALSVGWLYELPTDGPTGDRSQLQIVTASGVPLGPAHSIHADIRQTGDGAYSYRKGTLYVSMPGNRTLEPVTVRSPTQVSFAAVSFAAVLTLLALLGYCAQWQRRLFASPGAQALACRRAGVALAVGVLVAFLAAWLTTPLLVIFRADTPGYLLPALAAIQGGALETVERTLGYPVFLAAVIFLTGNLAHIPTAQVALVAATALATIGLLWLASRPRERGSLGLAFVQAVVMVATVAALLAYQPLTNYAHWLMSEALYTFLTVLNLLVVVAAFRERSAKSLLGLYLLGTLVSVYTYYVKPHWGAAMVLTWVLLTVRLFLRIGPGPRLRLPLALAAPVLAAAIALATFVVPQRILHETHGPRYTLFGPFTLFCVHADLVEPAIQQSGHPPALKAKLLKTLRETLDGSPGPFLMLGFDADYCFYRSSLQPDLNAHFQGDIRAQRDLLLGAFLAAVLQNPYGYLSKVMHQVAYALTNPFAFMGHRVGYRTDFYHALAKHQRMAAHQMPEAAMTGIEPRPLLTALPLVERLAADLLDVLNRFATLLWAGILAGACVLGVCWRRGSAACGRALVTMGLAAGLYLCSTVVVALAHSFDIERYLLALAPLALCAMTVCLLELLGALWGLRGAVDSPGSGAGRPVPVRETVAAAAE